MPRAGLLVIAPLRPGTEGPLLSTLNRLGNDVHRLSRSALGAEAGVDLPRTRTLHFGRLTLLDDPDRGAGRRRLLLATDYDGSWDDHVAELLECTQNPESIWGACDGYDGPATFPDFIRRHTVVPGAYYIAFRGRTLTEIRDAVRLRDDFQAALADPDRETRLRGLRTVLRVGGIVRAVWRTVRWPFATACRALATAVELLVLVGRHGVPPVRQAALRINATLDRIWWIRPFNRVFGNRHPAPPHPYTQAAPATPLPANPDGYPPEDAVLQNQLTLVTEVRPEAVPTLRAVLALIDLYGRRLSTPGSLVGIRTIHTVRWTLIDGERRLLMVSNYDGTWENYIDEFAEMILSGLDALWTSAPDYPQAGAQDVAALKQFLREHQAPASVFYSAYPSTSVLQLEHDLEWNAWFGQALRRRLRGETSGR